MRWDEVRALYPEQWLLVEALGARTIGRRRVFDLLSVVERCPDGATALRRHRELSRQSPDRELYFAHTGNVELEVEERAWPGIRRKATPTFA
jgi:hypothetical protein